MLIKGINAGSKSYAIISPARWQMGGENLRLDDLGRKGYMLLQDRDGYSFGTDSVLLADYAARGVKDSDNVADICAGAGAVGILLYARRENISLAFIELDEGRFGLLEKNIKLNKIPAKAYKADLREAPAFLKSSFSAVVANPPYFKAGSGAMPKNESVAMSKFETTLDLGSFLKASYALLKGKGKLFISYRPERLQELMIAMDESGFSVKAFRLVCQKPGSNAFLALVHAQKGASKGLIAESPLYITDSFGCQTEEFHGIYN